MRLINKILIVIFILCAKNSIHALPVQSKALENIDDQLFWQAAWFSEDNNERAASPFTSDSKRISPKSIFILPEKSSSYCATGYRIDSQGKCIKVVSIQQTSEETKLASIITTDDTASFDYDYFTDEDDNDEYIQTTDNLQLVSILNESNENINDDDNSNKNENTKKVIIKERPHDDEMHSTSVTQSSSSSNVIATSSTSSPAITFQNFHQQNKTDAVQVIIATLSSDNYGWESTGDKNESSSSSNMMTYDHDTATTSVNEFKNKEEREFESHTPSTFSSNSTTTTTTTTIAPFEYENITEMNSTTSVMQDRGNADSQNVEPSTSEESNSSTTSTNDDEDDLVEKHETMEGTIIEKINFDDVSLLQNESLLLSYEKINSTGIDYEDVTTLEPLIVDLTSSTDTSSSSMIYEGSSDDSDNPTTFDLDDQTFKYESYDGDQESANKFVYQHLTTSSITTASTESINKFKFPNDEDDDEVTSSQRIKFPDDDEIASSTQSTSTPSAALTSRFAWPRENHKITTNIFQFWNKQPLIADSLYRGRENSKSFRDNFFPYTRNQKVQIVTPQQRYSYSK